MKKKKKHNFIGKFFFGLLRGFTVFITAIALLTTTLAICDLACESEAHVLPDYPQEDISPILNKGSWTEADYRTLYLQTGLGKPALDELKGQNQRILEFQTALFCEVKLAHVDSAPTTPHDVMANFYAPVAPIQKGDVFVTNSCHTYGWRNGHAALVVQTDTPRLLQSIAPGYLSQTEGTSWFQHSSNFMILRLKGVSEEERAQLADKAYDKLVDLPYSLTVGVLSPKDQGENPAHTHCSHLVWQAYKYFGYDIDADGGPVVTSRDIANSPLFEVVQVFGFHPVRLWK